jgi:hypothetical protein
MPLAQSFIDPIREYFTLRRAESTVRAYAPGQQARVAEHVEAGRQRLAAGRKTTAAVPAAVLLRDAVIHFLLAAAVAKDPAGTGTPELDASSALPPLAPDPASPDAVPTDDARARGALASLATADVLYFDRLAPEDAERTRWALDRAAALARSKVEARTLTHLRGARWGRIAAIVLLAGYAAFAFVRARVVAPDIALGKPVHLSPHRAPPWDGHELTDGETGTTFTKLTQQDDNPNAVIDLLGRYWIDKVKIYNRADGWFDDCLPLVVELSQDGTHWEEIGRRTEHFEASPPWVVDGGGRAASFVRVRVDRKSYLLLSEVEVFGKKD